MISKNRLDLELVLLRKDFYNTSACVWEFRGIGTRNEHLMVILRSSAGKEYSIKIDFSNNYPFEIPKVFITKPVLRTRNGGSMLDVSGAMHTLSGENGWVRICHYGSSSWTPNVTLHKVVVKAKIWIEAYEAHLKTGQNLDYYLRHQR